MSGVPTAPAPGGSTRGHVPHPWWPNRQAALARAGRVALVAVLVAAAVAALLPDEAGSTAGALMVALLVAAPLVRVAWLGIRWARKGDRRFALVAAGLLAVVAAGTAVALVR